MMLSLLRSAGSRQSWLLTCLLLASTSPALHADEYQPGSEDELGELMALLAAETELATQTRMNADYVPGMVSVLYAEDGVRRGKQTVADLLADVAGFLVNETNNGDKRMIVRGIGVTQNASNLKLMIDGVAVNRPTDGSADWLFRMPLAAVDRIEVIRGPGSSVHGGFAFSGVVNVIPRQSRAVGGFVGSHQRRQADISLQTAADSEVEARISASFWRKGNSGLTTGPDNFAEEYSHAGSPVYDHERGALMLAGASWQGYELDINMVSAERGPGHGELAALPYEARPRIEQSFSVQLKKSWQPTSDLTLDASIDYLNTGLNEAMYVPIPAGVRRPGGQPASLYDVFRGAGDQDHSLGLSTSLTWQINDEHLLHANASSQKSRVDSSYSFRAVEAQNPQYGTALESRVVAGSERYINAIGIQDQWQLSDKLAVTAGVRFDQYTDWGNHVSPRLAAVWQVSDEHIFKAQYAEAFRPPSLLESHPGPDSVIGGEGHLSEEILRSLEAAWIYRNSRQRISLTLHRTEVEDLIEYFLDPGQPPIWRNRGDIAVNGAELEWKARLGRALEWDGNVSYTDARDYLDPDDKLLGSVDWMATSSLAWQMTDLLSSQLNVSWVGQQEGWEITGRSVHERRYPDYWLVDVGVEWRDAMAVDNLYLLLTCQNLADIEYRSVPSPSQYPEGLNHGGRQLALGAMYEF